MFDIFITNLTSKLFRKQTKKSVGGFYAPRAYLSVYSRGQVKLVAANDKTIRELAD